MGAIGRYIARTSFGAFLAVLSSLTAVVWVTHILRDIDIITNQGQTVLAFIGITSLVIPFLMLVVTPISLIVGVGYTLNKLNTDSEIVVMNASGMSPWRIFWPFLFVALVVAFFVGLTSAYLAPKALRELRTQLTKVRADLIANFIQPGRFTSVEAQRLTFHVRERRANGELHGILIDDRRDPLERATFLAERGRIVESEAGTFLVLEQGSAQRLEVKTRDPTIVMFDRYAFDLTSFTGATATPTFNVTERYLWDLIWVDPKDQYLAQNRGRAWAELNDRLAAPLYPIVFVVIGFAILGAPRTNRQSRSLSMLMTIVAVATVRLVGFTSVVMAARQPAAIGILYATLAGSLGVGLIMISRGTIVEAPAVVVNFATALQERIARMSAKPRGASA